jgi:hypothetical protein
MKTFNVSQFYNGFCCYFKFTYSSFDKGIKLFTLFCLGSPTKKKALTIFGKNSPLSSHYEEKEFEVVIFRPNYNIFVSMFKDVLFDVNVLKCI